MTESLDELPRPVWLLILALPFIGTAIALTVSTYMFYADIGG